MIASMRSGVEVASVETATNRPSANSSRERIRKLPPPEKTSLPSTIRGLTRPGPPGIRMTA